MVKVSFRQKVLEVREHAIVAAVNRLLASKGFDAMTVDEVAAEVGIAKASLYKHFTSKEELAGAAMVAMLERALAYVDGLQANDKASALEQLQAVARWTIQEQLAGQMPLLPAQNSVLRQALMGNQRYLERLMALSQKLSQWIAAAQQARQLNPQLPTELVLYTLYARACDPVLALLRAGGQYSDEGITDMLLLSCFEGLAAR
jgi:TetR/AcrR family transcriptional regulator, regulator of autoinduction and epiphytic fitness